jgi:hypothetical protein
MRRREVGEQLFSLGRVRALSLQLLKQPHLMSYYAGALVDDVYDVFDVHADSLIVGSYSTPTFMQSTPAPAPWLRPIPARPI